MLDGNVKKMEQSGDCRGLVKLLVNSEGRLNGMKCFDIVDALERLGPAAVPALAAALDEGHPGVPAALARIGPASLPGLSRKLPKAGPDAQIGAALAILMMRLHGDPIDTDTSDQLEALRDTSPYLQVVAFAIAGLRPRDKSRISGYYKTAAPKRPLMEYQRGIRDSWQWAESAAHLAYRSDLNLRHDVADNAMVALRECDKASRASSPSE